MTYTRSYWIKITISIYLYIYEIKCTFFLSLFIHSMLNSVLLKYTYVM